MGMDEYIKRKEAIAVACKGCNKEFSNEPCEPYDCHIQQGLFNIPAADVVEVVPCDKCKRHLKCPIEERFHRVENRYCCLGERREGE